jgi:myo-inositol-1(or 4)-monophosphatase
LASPLAKTLEAEIATRLAVARSAAGSAGAILLGHFGKLQGYDEKSAIDFVSVADRESEASIEQELRAAFPSDVLVLEEADGRSGADEKRTSVEAAEFAWCIDPLDGTTNFVHSHPQFSISIGLLHRGRPVLGLVHAPALGETFIGGRDRGATLNDRPITVSKVDRLSRALLSTGFPYYRRERVDALLAVVKEAILTAQDIRRAGSAALDLAFVACGRTDAFFEEGLSPWDVAAGHAIVEGAGGKVTRYDGAAHDLFKKEILATNGLIHTELEEMIARVRR